MRVVFMGTPTFAVPCLDALARAGHDLAAVVAQPDRPAGRGQALREPATKVWAKEKGVPVLQPEKVRDGRLAAAIAALRPDVVCVAAYGRILGKDLLDLAPHGAVNVHGSLLPKYRGAAPIQWAIARDDTAERLAPRLAALGGEALVEALARAADGGLVPVPQDGAGATLAPILSREDGRIDWTRGAREIFDRLRGFTPWPGAWTTLDGKVLKVLEAEVEDVRASEAPSAPGTATVVPGRGLAVSCAHPTALLVRRVQLEGKGPQAAADFANGLRRKQLALGT